MAVPKRKHSHQRTNKRKSQWKASLPTTIVCPHCGQPKRPHRVCLQCGHYKGEEVVLVKS